MVNDSLIHRVGWPESRCSNGDFDIIASAMTTTACRPGRCVRSMVNDALYQAHDKVNVKAAGLLCLSRLRGEVGSRSDPGEGASPRVGAVDIYAQNRGKAPSPRPSPRKRGEGAHPPRHRQSTKLDVSMPQGERSGAVIPADRRRGRLRASRPAARSSGDAARDGRPDRSPWRLP
jgi:hypothetical protein